MKTRVVEIELLMLLLISVVFAQDPAALRRSFVETMMKVMDNELGPGYTISVAGTGDTQFVMHTPEEGLAPLTCNLMVDKKEFVSRLRRYGFNQLVCTGGANTSVAFDLVSGKQLSPREAPQDFASNAGALAFVLAPICIGLIPAYIAKRKGRSLVAWWFYGAAIFIVALPHSLAIKPADRVNRASLGPIS